MNRWTWCVAAVLAGCGGAGEVPEDGCALLLGTAAFTQGALVASDSPLDLALDGPGFFVLAKGDVKAYSRRGHFTVDAEGHVLGPRGYRVQAFAEDGAAHPSDLVLGPTTFAPVATRTIFVKGNLNAAASPKAFDPLDPASTSELQSTVNIFDSLGRVLTVDLYWNKFAGGTWEFHALTDGSGVRNGSSGWPTEIGSGRLDFDTDGRLVTVTQQSSLESPEATAQPLQFELGDPSALGGSGLDGMTQFASASATTFTAQDGLDVGFLQAFEFDDQGRLLGTYSNGAVTLLGRVALANFEHPMGLRPARDLLLLEGAASGSAMLGVAREGGFGAIVIRALEVLREVDGCR